jgi:hypothetical protein
MAYQYWIEPMTLDEKLMGKTTARNVSERAKVLENRFNQLAGQGWELVSIGQIDITGAVFKSNEVRDISVAVFRREYQAPPQATDPPPATHSSTAVTSQPDISMAGKTAGWLPDPDDPTLDRYWSGQQWMQPTRPRS